MTNVIWFSCILLFNSYSIIVITDNATKPSNVYDMSTQADNVQHEASNTMSTKLRQPNHR